MQNMRLGVTRCQGITTSGERCKKRGRFPKGYCLIHVAQAKKIGVSGYATFAGAAAATVTVIEKIIEALPYFMGDVNKQGIFKKDAVELLEMGRFRELDGLLAKQGRSMPQRLQEKARHQILQFHALLPQLDTLSEIKRRELGREISKRLHKDDAI